MKADPRGRASERNRKLNLASGDRVDHPPQDAGPAGRETWRPCRSAPCAKDLRRTTLGAAVTRQRLQPTRASSSGVISSAMENRRRGPKPKKRKGSRAAGSSSSFRLSLSEDHAVSGSGPAVGVVAPHVGGVELRGLGQIDGNQTVVVRATLGMDSHHSAKIRHG